MTKQVERANALKKLHINGSPVILFNVWDAGSAKAIAEIGGKVVATSSWAMSVSQGYEDGEKMPFDLVIATLKQIVSAVDLPVTLDLEGGYGKTPQDVQANVKKVIEAGAVGINIEDTIIGGKGLRSIEDQSARIKACSDAAKQASVPLFINARTDIFLKTDAAGHDEALLEKALASAAAYAQAGAHGFFVPGLNNPKLIEKLCKLSPLPVNIIILKGTPFPKALAEMGVARISYGPSPYHDVLAAFKEAGRKALKS